MVCWGWDGEIEKPELDSVILIFRCPVAEHLRESESFALNKDVNSTCANLYELLVDMW
jgi:hypothetical protein